MLSPQPIFTITAELGPIRVFGRTPYGERRVIDILGGSVSGPRLTGRILRGGADFVVLDCGPAAAGPDAGLLARLADATVLVSRRGQLRSPLVANAARILTDAQAAPIGIVVTK